MASLVEVIAEAESDDDEDEDDDEDPALGIAQVRHSRAQPRYRNGFVKIMHRFMVATTRLPRWDSLRCDPAAVHRASAPTPCDAAVPAEPRNGAQARRRARWCARRKGR